MTLNITKYIKFNIQQQTDLLKCSAFIKQFASFNMRIMFTLIKHFSHWKHLEIGHLLRFLQELGRFSFSTALIKDTEYAIFKHTLIWPSLSLSCWVCVSRPSCERCSNSCHRNPSPEEALLVLKCSDGCYLHVFVRGKTLWVQTQTHFPGMLRHAENHSRCRLQSGNEWKPPLNLSSTVCKGFQGMSGLQIHF